MGFKGSQRIGILRCQFSDNLSEPFDDNYFQDLFITRGTQGLNDYFITASIGAINFDGSKLFPWKSCNLTLADFNATYAGRGDKVGVACSTHGITRADFDIIIAIYNDNVNDAGNDGQRGILAWITGDDMQLTFFAHELGHCFGLMDSYDESDRLIADDHTYGWYWDQYDIMSARNVFSHADERWNTSGPLMCCANQDYNQWIPESRIWSPKPGENDTQTIDIVSLNHTDVPGYICIKFDGWYVEFRTVDGFDAGLPHPCVLIHSITPQVNATVHNYSHSGDDWDNEWLPGRTFGPSNLVMSLVGGTRIEVLSFDLKHYTARILIRTATARSPIRSAGPGILFGGVAVDGGGVIILPDGTVIKIPPRSPVMGLVSQVALVSQVEERLSGRAKSAVTAEMYKEVEGMARRASQKASKELEKYEGSSTNNDFRDSI
jgi:hypothetical protein